MTPVIRIAQVEVDDESRADHGMVYYTLPKREKEDKIMARLLLKHGTDFKAMRLDISLNPGGLDKGQLRRRAMRMLVRRSRMPPKWLWSSERKQRETMTMLLQRLRDEKEKKRDDVLWTAWALESSGKDNPLGLEEVSRVQQIENAREAARDMLMGGGFGPGVTLRLPAEAQSMIGWGGAGSQALVVGQCGEAKQHELALLDEIGRGRPAVKKEANEVEELMTLDVRGTGERLVLPSFMQGEGNRIQ